MHRHLPYYHLLSPSIIVNFFLQSPNLWPWTLTTSWLGRPLFEAFKGQAQSPKEEGAFHFIPCPKQPLQSNNQDLVISNFFFLWKQIDNLSTIVWVSIPVRPKHSFKSPSPWSKSIAMHAFWRAAACGVKGPEAEFLVSCNLMGGKST